MQQVGEGTTNDAVVRNGDDATGGKETMVASRFASPDIELTTSIFVKIFEHFVNLIVFHLEPKISHGV